MNWKKWSLLLTLVFAISVFLAACGGGDDSGGSEGKMRVMTKDPVTLVKPHWRMISR